MQFKLRSLISVITVEKQDQFSVVYTVIIFIICFTYNFVLTALKNFGNLSYLFVYPASCFPSFKTPMLTTKNNDFKHSGNQVVLIYRSIIFTENCICKMYHVFCGNDGNICLNHETDSILIVRKVFFNFKGYNQNHIKIIKTEETINIGIIGWYCFRQLSQVQAFNLKYFMKKLTKMLVNNTKKEFRLMKSLMMSTKTINHACERCSNIINVIHSCQ